MKLSRLALITFCVLATPSSAGERDDVLLHFFGSQGCVLGPESRAAAIEDGFDEAVVDIFIADRRAEMNVPENRPLATLPRESCTIRMPLVSSEIALTDPVFTESLSAVDAYAEEDSPGCFFEGTNLLNALEKIRGWSAERAWDEYFRLLAGGIRSGAIAWYSPSPLRTPYSYQLTTGGCSEVPAIADIRFSHAFLVENFDALVRAFGEAEICGETSARAPLAAVRSAMRALSDDERLNAWYYIEILTIGHGAGWFDNASRREKGTPRPPLCHYE